MNTPELLSPAGTLKNLRYALAYGADAVYAGMPRYSLRVRNNEFSTLASLKQGIDETHALGRKFLLATNILPHQAKLKTFLKDMAPIIELSPDALIMADPGLILLIRENWPDMPIHLSVQANTTNAQAVRFWQQMGVSRVILSRELSLDEVESIRQQCPDMEIEVFVHGALCMAYSGRCMLSGYFNHRDANQGSCTNACRWEYKLEGSDAQAEHDGGCGSEGCGGEEPAQALPESVLVAPPLAANEQRHPEADKLYYLEESNRPGEKMPIFEDEHGTYIMNSRDLRAVEHVQRLVDIGVDCLKIEGRTKSHYYAARTASVYRRAIDDAVSGRDLNPHLLTELSGLANRGYTDAFYQRHTPDELQNYLDNYSKSDKELFVGEVCSQDTESGWATIEVKNKFAVGDELELLTPSGNTRFTLDSMLDEHGHPMDMVPGNGRQVRVPLPAVADENCLISRHLG